MPESLDYLLVDDDEVFANTLARSLTKRGFSTDIALDGRRAISSCKLQQPARIVLDLKLGTESGLNLIDALKQAAPRASIVILTGYSSIPTTVEAIKLGAHNYLCKPASTDDIIAIFESGTTPTQAPIPDQPPSVNRLEWEHIQKVLNENNGNISATARALGMHRRTLQRKLLKRPVKN